MQAHNVKRGASIGLGVYESAATSVQQRPLAGRADKPGRRAGRYRARQRLIQVVLRCRVLLGVDQHRARESEHSVASGK